MNQPLFDVKGLFRENIDRMNREHEEMVKDRIRLFNERHHKIAEDEHMPPQKEAKIRPI